MTETVSTDHAIETLQRLTFDPPRRGAAWHEVTCSCGWTRKYVSHYRALVMHDRHARELATETA
jgi:hypothetical protein